MDFEHEDIARLAQGFARELTAGRLGAKGEIARLYIETNPDAALDLLALLSEETSRETTDEFKLQAYLHLFGHALAQIRYHVDSGYDWAEQIADVVRQEVAVLAEDEQIDGQQLIALMGCFREAKLDPGEELRRLTSEWLTRDDGLEREIGPGDFEASMEELARAAKGDAFGLYDQLLDICENMPPELQQRLIEQAAAAPLEVLREVAVLWLLDPSARTRACAAEVLARPGPAGAVSSRSLARMLLLRDWLPEAERPVLDRAIDQVRASGTEPLSRPRRLVEQALGTAIDGAGAQSVFAVVKEGRKHTFGGLLVKQKVGLADVWCRHQQSKSEVKDLIRTLRSEMGAETVKLDFIANLLRHHLAVGAKQGSPPPAALLDFVESVGLAECQARERSNDDILEALRPSIDPALLRSESVARILEQALEWPSISRITESWYVDDRQARDFILGQRQRDWKARVDHLLDELLEQRREEWCQRFSWTALWAKSAGQRVIPWVDFFVLAQELRGSRPLREIPIMRRIAETTLTEAAFIE